MRATAEPYSYDPETDPLLKIPPEPQGQSEAQPELVYLDHLGTPIAAHNVKGEAVWTAEYEAWGRIRNKTVSDGLKANIPFRFQGQYYDEESGLHYNRFRYYDPEIGRFVNLDPIGLMGGINVYVYAPNPIRWVDPNGLSPVSQNCRNTKYSRGEVITKVTAIVKLHQNQIKKVAPDAHVGLRGSLVTGKRGNGTPWDQIESDIDAWVASKTLFDGNNRYPRELKPVENSINTAIKTALPCLRRGGKVFSFKTQRHNFIEGARARSERIITIF
ncbi:hypothetical protein NM96_04440 [Neisseria mucosa]|nr:hypothetical protein NM96_04440 [Neisseria mucosa]